MGEFTHVDDRGRATMVDVSDKEPTARVARAAARVVTTPEVIEKIREMTVAKGPVLETARIAGIQAAKRTADLIPLCHPLPIDKADVTCTLAEGEVLIETEVRTFAKTGVEMEALTAASVAALTVYDMCKAQDRAMTITEVRLIEKSGGRSGVYRREP